ncbi:MAG: phosphopentomutase [Christensenellales bacterium]|jgi:phosphopentomutase
MRVFLTVIDSFGVGELPDAHLFGDEGSNTYVNIYNKTKVDLKTMIKMGLNAIEGINLPYDKNALIGSFAKLSEKTMAKDTTAGHYEISGILLEKPYPVFPNAFSKEFVKMLEDACGVCFIGNEVASGTEIIARLGKQHIEEKKPILYTSQDSVLQIAAHEEVFPLERLYDICQKARTIATGDYNVARVIARPFITVEGEFVRTPNRHDFALSPPMPSVLDKLHAQGFDTLSVGKVYDVFTGSGISQKFAGKNNTQGLDSIEEILSKDFNGLMFANLVDTDMLFGHRNDFVGYANALKEIDNRIEKWLPELREDDIFIVTADHGCDPTTPSTDHSREYVPLLVYGKQLKKGINLGVIHGFDIIAKSILDLFGVEEHKDSFLRKLMQN